MTTFHGTIAAGAFTYDLSTDVGKVRLLIPDNDSTAYFLTDSEIEYFLGETANVVNAAAVMACNQLARQFAQKATFSADGLTIQHSQRAEVFAKRAAELGAEIAGGITAVELDRQDGYHTYAPTTPGTEYGRQWVYVQL